MTTPDINSILTVNTVATPVSDAPGDVRVVVYIGFDQNRGQTNFRPKALRSYAERYMQALPDALNAEPSWAGKIHDVQLSQEGERHALVFVLRNAKDAPGFGPDNTIAPRIKTCCEELARSLEGPSMNEDYFGQSHRSPGERGLVTKPPTAGARTTDSWPGIPTGKAGWPPAR